MSEPLIRAESLSKHFVDRTGILARLLPGEVRTVYAVDNVDLSINPGQTIGLVGESGCGKTTLGKTLLRLHEPTSGSIYYQGQDLTALSKRQFQKYRKDLQIIFQDPFSSLNPRMSVKNLIMEPMKIHSVYDSDEERQDRLDELLDSVGLDPESAEKMPHEFSGGQKQRIMIARALSTDPKFIVADEPTSALDVSVKSKILNLLKDLQEEYDLTMLFIGHNISSVKFISDEIAVMYLGEIVEQAQTRKIIRTPHHPYTQALFSAIPIPGQNRENRILLEGEVPTPTDPPRGCSFHPRCQYATTKCREKDPELEATDDGDSRVACHHHKIATAEYADRSDVLVESDHVDN